VPVFLGSWIGAHCGRWRRACCSVGCCLRYVRLSVVRYIGAGVCAILGVVTVISALAA